MGTETYLFPADIISQDPDNTTLPGWPQDDANASGGNLIDYGMDPDASNNPSFSNAVAIGGTTYYSAHDANGWELWKSDGTSAGTVMVKDIWTGSAGGGFGNSSFPTNLTVMGTNIYFKASDGSSGYELWKSDGTSAGTVRVADISGGAGSGSPTQLTPMNNVLYFVATDGSTGYELWKYDPSTSTTSQVKDIATGANSSWPGSLTAVQTALGWRLFFTADDGTNGREPWVSDGTSAGTFMLKNIYPGNLSSNPSYLTAFTPQGGTPMAYFAAADDVNGNELWRSDGTSAGTILIKDINPGAGGSSPSFLTAIGQTLYFGAWTPDIGNELWRSDGTAAGTALVKDLDPGVSNSTPCFLTNLNGTLYFQAQTTANGRELWRSDGTTAGTSMAADLNPGALDSDPSNLVVVGNAVYFTATTPFYGYELYKANAIGVTLVRDIDPGIDSSRPLNLVNANGTLFFQANAGNYGYELWKSNGTAAGTMVVKDLRVASAYNDSSIGNLTEVGVSPTYNLFFTAYSATAGQELWKSNGTLAGTALVLDINPGIGDSNPSWLTNVNGTCFFAATDPVYGTELWKSDGTAVGTVLVKDINTSGDSSPSNLTNINGILYFSAYDPSDGVELWRSDGTAAGTTLLKDINPGAGSSYPTNLFNINGTLYFTAYDPVDGMQLWKSDGTSIGTTMVKVVGDVDDSTWPHSLTNVNSTLFFITNKNELWKSDGTANGTVLVMNFAGDQDHRPGNLTNVNGTLFFSAWDATDGQELWKSDGTAAGTVLVKDICPGSDGSDPNYFVNYSNKLYFSAYQPDTGTELWMSDGTPAGTTLVKDIRTGGTNNINAILDSSPAYLTLASSYFFFAANDGTNGVELWQSNGSSATTVLSTSQINTSGDSNPSNLTKCGSAVYFTAYNPTYGIELYMTTGSTITRLSDAMANAGTARPFVSVLQPEDLESIPTFSIVMSQSDLFGTSGWYRGSSGAEKAGSLELIGGADGDFQTVAGFTVRGGYSGGTNNPKHGIHIHFRNDPGYGGVLSYPLLGPDGADKFNRIDLRTMQNYSWSFEHNDHFIGFRDQFMRNLQTAMGEPDAKGDFYYLYINGVLWGLYDTDERPYANDAARRWGGNPSNWDTIKVTGAEQYYEQAADGTMVAWTNFWNEVVAMKTSANPLADYMKLQGKNPDGTPNAAYQDYLDSDNLIDYILTNYWGGNMDAPLSNFLGNSQPNNCLAVRDRTGASGGFKFFNHDGEHTLDSPSSPLSTDRIGPGTGFWYDTYPITNVAQSNPQTIFEILAEYSPEFRQRIADRVHQWFYNDGALTPAALTELFKQSEEELYSPVLVESARWGDSSTPSNYPETRDGPWTTEINYLLNTYLPQRSGIVLQQLKTHLAGGQPLYPGVDAPEFNQYGGVIGATFQLTINNPNLSTPGSTGTIYYTTDGSDPRLPGGAINPSAHTYGTSFPIAGGTWVNARIYYYDTTSSTYKWTALTDAYFTSDTSSLRISEVMYNPAPPTPAESGGGKYTAQDYEYLELVNTGTATINLKDVKLTHGVTFSFPNMTLAPGARTLIVHTLAAFELRYPGISPSQIAGTYSGALSNGGDEVTLTNAAGNAIQDFTYNNSWYPITDGGGYSLVLIDPLQPNSTFSSASAWRPSNIYDGGPGVADDGINPNTVAINEVMSYPSSGNPWIELRNTTTQPVDISGWFLAGFGQNDTVTDTMIAGGYRLPSSTIVPAADPNDPSKGYLVLSQSLFGGSFSLSPLGGHVVLANNIGAIPAGYRADAVFGGSDQGVSFGQYYVASTGNTDLTAMSTPTPARRTRRRRSARLSWPRSCTSPRRGTRNSSSCGT